MRFVKTVVAIVLALIGTVLGGALCLTIIGFPVGVLVLAYTYWPLTSIISNRAHAKGVARHRRQQTRAIGPDLYPWEKEGYDPNMN